tara:strand:- start:1901 stop:2188 length:288 start_codon:yes stop_codon:yes gene_type:complete
MKLTSKKVKDYFAWRTDEPLEHCPDCISAACNEMANKYNTEFCEDLKAKELMGLLFFNDPIPSLHTHSYGFHTATGRNIIETLKMKYYEHKDLKL